MTFPQVAVWLTNAAALVKVLGIGMFLIGIGVGAISLMSAGIFQSVNREVYGKTALILCGIGLFVVLTAPVWESIVAQIAGVKLP